MKNSHQKESRLYAVQMLNIIDRFITIKVILNTPYILLVCCFYAVSFYLPKRFLGPLVVGAFGSSHLFLLRVKIVR